MSMKTGAERLRSSAFLEGDKEQDKDEERIVLGLDTMGLA
jgi:hypothetical protein